MHTKLTPPRPIVRVSYQPPASYALDVEIFPLAELFRRASSRHLSKPQRVEFHELLYFTQGSCSHTVDFEPLYCRRGTLLVLSPGQIQCFDARPRDWDGWMVLFRPEFLPARTSAAVVSEQDALYQLVDLAVHRTLGLPDQEAVAEALERMAEDVRLDADANLVHALLRHQLLALLVRLHLIQARTEPVAVAAPASLQRFKRYRLVVEREFRRLHRVADYADLIGCSQKSLQRAALEVGGVSAKAFLSQRVVLEAKRLLVHTDHPMSIISDELGFDEATNFVKFFRRETGMPPGEFRRRHVGPQ